MSLYLSSCWVGMSHIEIHTLFKMWISLKYWSKILLLWDTLLWFYSVCSVRLWSVIENDYFLRVIHIISNYNIAIWDFKKVMVLRHNTAELNPAGYQKCASEPSLSSKQSLSKSLHEFSLAGPIYWYPTEWYRDFLKANLRTESICPQSWKLIMQTYPSFPYNSTLCL